MLLEDTLYEQVHFKLALALRQVGQGTLSLFEKLLITCKSKLSYWKRPHLNRKNDVGNISQVFWSSCMMRMIGWNQYIFQILFFVSFLFWLHFCCAMTQVPHKKTLKLVFAMHRHWWKKLFLKWFIFFTLVPAFGGAQMPVRKPWVRPRAQWRKSSPSIPQSIWRRKLWGESGLLCSPCGLHNHKTRTNIYKMDGSIRALYQIWSLIRNLTFWDRTSASSFIRSH